MVSQAHSDIDQAEFVMVNLLSEEQVQSKVDGTVQSVKNSALIRLASLVKYIATNTRANEIISSLHINTAIEVWFENGHYAAGHRIVEYLNLPTGGLIYRCTATNLTLPSILSTFTLSPLHTHPTISYYELVDGFIAACSTIERVLYSTLDCLTDTTCLEQLRRYFPGLQQVRRW